MAEPHFLESAATPTPAAVATAGPVGAAIALYARHTPGFEARLAHAVAMLQSASTAHLGRIVQASSLGAEDMVLMDLIAGHKLPIAVATLQTGQLHPQTLALLAHAESHYGLTIERHAPEAQAVVHFVAQHGERAMFESIALRQACCALRKLQPLARLLGARTAWVSGLRREQSSQRARVPFSETDAHGRIKFNPLADWSQADVWHYIASRQVPYNALHDAHFPSIGCAPCTRAIAVGEDPRAGRWWWEHEAAKECGLHVNAATQKVTA